MFKLSPLSRINLGLVSLLTSVLLVASIAGFFPDQRTTKARARRQLCESIAICFSGLANKSDIDSMKTMLEAIQTRNSDLLSIGVRDGEGNLLLEVGHHEDHWTQENAAGSSDDGIFVDLFAGTEEWGRLETRFQSQASSWFAAFGRSEVLHACFVALICALAYYLYLRRVLQQLNPSNVVPNRVRDALNTLAEGLLVLDHKQRVVLANRSLEQSTGCDALSIVGKSVESLGFVSRDESRVRNSPWTEAVETGSPVKGRLVGLRERSDELTFSVGASPIVDEQGRHRGALVSFDDVTSLENKKRELTTMVSCLRESSDEIKRQNRELEFLATVDPLTGCLNRRSFFARFESEWQAAERYGVEISAVMVDIDHFKSINDEHGHSAGDDVLRSIAKSLTETARESDVVARYGGEEFCVLMPHTSIDAAEQAAERLREGIEALNFPQLSLSASLGVSSRSLGAMSPQELLDCADKCLYVAKRNGRNQVVRWDAVPEELDIENEQVRRDASTALQEDSAVIPFHAVTALISALAYRDQETALHSRRVADLCVRAGEGLLSLSRCYTLEVAALLHDIGKIGVPDSILLKPAPLTEEEWEIMRRNDKIGAEIVRASFASAELSEIVEKYQTPCEQGDLPLGAKILAIADAYDSMTSDRCYREGLSEQQACEELRRCAGSQFDAELVERFITTIDNAPVSQTENEVSKESALRIGLQIERLSAALDNQDLDSLTTLSKHLQQTATKSGASSIARKANELADILDTDRDAYLVMHSAYELLDLCRSTQASLLPQRPHCHET